MSRGSARCATHIQKLIETQFAMEERGTVSVESEPGPARRTRSAAAKGTAAKKKVVRRDPDKRRLQNRLAQKTYSEYYETLRGVFYENEKILSEKF